MLSTTTKERLILKIVYNSEPKKYKVVSLSTLGFGTGPSIC